MTSCRSSRTIQEQRTAERLSDAKGDTLLVYVNTTDTLIVHDTVRETVTVTLNAEGDTTRKDTSREHVTDRTRQQRNESLHEATHQESHEREATDDKKEKVVEQPKQNPLKPFLWGALAGIVLTVGGIIFVKLRKR